MTTHINLHPEIDGGNERKMHFKSDGYSPDNANAVTLKFCSGPNARSSQDVTIFRLFATDAELLGAIGQMGAQDREAVLSFIQSMQEIGTELDHAEDVA